MTASNRNWRKATGCESAACVEVAESTELYGMRDSKNPDDGELWFERDAWAAFIEDVRSGALDRANQ